MQLEYSSSAAMLLEVARALGFAQLSRRHASSRAAIGTTGLIGKVEPVFDARRRRSNEPSRFRDLHEMRKRLRLQSWLLWAASLIRRVISCACLE